MGCTVQLRRTHGSRREASSSHTVVAAQPLLVALRPVGVHEVVHDELEPRLDGASRRPVSAQVGHQRTWALHPLRGVDACINGSRSMNGWKDQWMMHGWCRQMGCIMHYDDLGEVEVGQVEVGPALQEARHPTLGSEDVVGQLDQIVKVAVH